MLAGSDVAGLNALRQARLLLLQLLRLCLQGRMPFLTLRAYLLHALVEGLQFAIGCLELTFDAIFLVLYLGVVRHALDDTLHFRDAFLQDALLAEMVALFLKEFREAIALFLPRAVLVGDALLNGGDEQAANQRVIRAAVLKKGLDTTLGLVDGGDFVPFRRDDAEMFLNVAAIALQGIVLGEEVGVHIARCQTAAEGGHFLFGGRPLLAVFPLHQGQVLDAAAIGGTVFIGKLLRGQDILAVQEEGDQRERVTAGVILENPLHGNVGSRITQLQGLLNLALSHSLMRQHGLNQGLYEDGLACAVLQQQDAVEAVKTERGINITLAAAVVDDIREADTAD